MKKQILITGSTDGIGKLAAIQLAKEGHQIAIHGRKKQKVADVISEIKKVSNNTEIQGFVADLSTISAVQELAETIKNTLTKLDILINNAGVFKSANALTSDGLDLRFAVNYIAPYVLTNALLPLFNHSNTGRIINLSSAAQSTVSLVALTGKQEISQGESYAQSKLALTMWSFNLAKQLQNTNVIAVNPGSLLNTNMVKEAYGHHWSSADKGANILCELAVSETHKEVTGLYFDNDKGSYGKAHEDAYDATKIDKLISLTDQIIS